MFDLIHFGISQISITPRYIEALYHWCFFQKILLGSADLNQILLTSTSSLWWIKRRTDRKHTKISFQYNSFKFLDQQDVYSRICSQTPNRLLYSYEFYVLNRVIRRRLSTDTFAVKFLWCRKLDSLLSFLKILIRRHISKYPLRSFSN